MSDALPTIPTLDLQLVPVPVSDIDRAVAFYDKIFGNKHDTQVTPDMRVVQFTPPGSGCAIVFGTGMPGISDMQPGSVKGLHLVVDNIETAGAALKARDVTISDVQDMGGVKYASFEDPDGNVWLLQQWPANYDGAPGQIKN